MLNNPNRHYEEGPKTPEDIEEFWRDLGREDQTPSSIYTKPLYSDSK